MPDDIGGVQARALPPATVLLLCTYYYGGISIRVTLACRFAMLYLLPWRAGVPCPALLTPMACDRTASAAFSHARCAVLAWRCSLLTRASSSSNAQTQERDRRKRLVTSPDCHVYGFMKTVYFSYIDAAPQAEPQRELTASSPPLDAAPATAGRAAASRELAPRGVRRRRPAVARSDTKHLLFRLLSESKSAWKLARAWRDRERARVSRSKAYFKHGVRSVL